MSTTQDRTTIQVRDGYAEIGDVRLHYVEAGEGPLVVLLHGFPEFWYGWRQQIEPLAAAGFRVVPLANAEFLDQRLPACQPPGDHRRRTLRLGGRAGQVRLGHPRLDYGQPVMT